MTFDLGFARQHHIEFLGHAEDIDAHARQQIAHGRAFLVQQGLHQVFRFDELMIATDSDGLGIGQRHLESACQLVHSHGIPSLII